MTRALAIACGAVPSAAPDNARYGGTSWHGQGGVRRRHVPIFADARAHRPETDGTTTRRGGRDGLARACDEGGPDEHGRACLSMREDGE